MVDFTTITTDFASVVTDIGTAGALVAGVILTTLGFRVVFRMIKRA